MDLAGKVILIVGVSNDIGYTLAHILHEYGATVVGTYYQNKIEELYDTYKCDIRCEEDINNLITKIIDKHEKLDVVINLASLSLDNDLYDKSKDEFMQVVEVNLVGTFLLNKIVSKYMDRGIIINMSSTDGIDTYRDIAMDYSSSKAGINILTKCLAQRLPNLKICAIAPNWVDTKETRKMDPEYLKKELERCDQDRLLTKEEVALKIIEIMIDDDIRSGEIIKMGGRNE